MRMCMCMCMCKCMCICMCKCMCMCMCMFMCICMYVHVHVHVHMHVCACACNKRRAAGRRAAASTSSRRGAAGRGCGNRTILCSTRRTWTRLTSSNTKRALRRAYAADPASWLRAAASSVSKLCLSVCLVRAVVCLPKPPDQSSARPHVICLHVIYNAVVLGQRQTFPYI